MIRPIKIVKNHWGWSFSGIKTWLSYGLGFSVWGIEENGRVRRRVKVCLVTFDWGHRR